MSSDPNPKGEQTRFTYRREKHAAVSIQQAQDYREKRFVDRHGGGDTDRKEKQIVSMVLTQLGVQNYCLDVPCGAGRFLEDLRSHSAHLLEMDLSFGMLQFNKNQYNNLIGGSGSDSTGFVRGDAEWLPIRTSSVDAVFCMRLFHHLDTSQLRVNILKEFARVTRQWVILSFYHYYCFKHLKKILRNKAHRGVYLPFHTVKTEAEHSGLRVIRTYAVTKYYNPQWIVVLKRNDMSSNR
jgi:ubiquinone/menaquinone biosynthesis C-methylase UbiE